MPPLPKLSPLAVAKLRALKPFFDAGILTQRPMAEKLGISQSTLNDILKGKKRKNEPPVDWQPEVKLTPPAEVQAIARQFGGLVITAAGVVTLPPPDGEPSASFADGEAANTDTAADEAEAAQ